VSARRICTPCSLLPKAKGEAIAMSGAMRGNSKVKPVSMRNVDNSEYRFRTIATSSPGRKALSTCAVIHNRSCQALVEDFTSKKSLEIPIYDGCDPSLPEQLQTSVKGKLIACRRLNMVFCFRLAVKLVGKQLMNAKSAIVGCADANIMSRFGRHLFLHRLWLFNIVGLLQEIKRGQNYLNCMMAN